MAVELKSKPTEEISRPYSKSLPTWENYLKKAAKTKFGQDIEVFDLEEAKKKELQDFVNDLVFKVVHCKDPMVTQPCMIDVINKEFYNNGDTEKVETDIITGKNTAIAAGTKYHFLIKDGVCFDHKVNLGAQIVSISMIGCDMRVGDSITERDQGYNEDLKFQYDHKEKIVIPPLTKVTAVITTSTKKFEQNYTLEFRIAKSKYIKVQYLSRRQRRWGWLLKVFKYCCFCCYCCCFCCCRCLPSVGYVSASEILQEMPNFDADDEYCYFTLEGTLTWIGEECSVRINPSNI